jgi:hypothetical protein
LAGALGAVSAEEELSLLAVRCEIHRHRRFRRRQIPHGGVGRGCGVGRVLGVGIDRGVGVGRGVGVTVAVGVGVAVGVAVGVGVGVTVGVGVGPTPGKGYTYAPRLRVQTERVVLPRSICMSQTIACGTPFSKRAHVGDATVISSV